MIRRTTRISRTVLPGLLLFLSTCGIAAEVIDTGRPDSAFLARKQIRAVRFADPVKIDGIPDEPAWQISPVAQGFVEYSPLNGAYPVFDSEVRFGFDDFALYICAVMYDDHPDSICRELGRRDQIEALNTDSALRFPKVEDQVWGINMWRHIRRFNQWSTWCFVDNSVRELFNYYGELTGIHNINPPLRLSVSPYVTGYLEKNPGHADWSYFIRGGMDLKFGISDSYTLDMMLIPDFGQVQSDDVVLNLTPFEIRYDEKRQFFTEGTELFDKCGIFYSRRVGDRPRNYYAPYDSLRGGEVVTLNPEVTRIINATKISGRNAKGLGFGFFNAMSTNTLATITDTLSGASRRVPTQPFTNYSVLVADQNLRNNSYVTFINTNYWIPQDGYVGNVTGLESRIGNKQNTFQAFGRLNISQLYQTGLFPVPV